ncbi:MAG TPA: VCBS repeat-containing protein, partial [Cyclobacteriaceae bacterium]
TDTITKKIFAGTRSSMLYQYNNKFVLEDTFKLNSPPSSILFGKQNEFIISNMGIMDPNDRAVGEIIRLKNNTSELLVDSLKRPVFIEQADLDNDKKADFVVCEFGNYTGALTAYKNLGDDRYEKHIIFSLPGARKIIARDVNHDGLTDLIVLMTQGDEQIALLTNSGNFNFRITTLLRFPPVYGSSFMEITDFNHDGNFDILYTNGDNADYSTILKPYHGVRVFMNDGKNKFNESWFYNMHGASQALARDFDSDGDIDIAAISFFPDFDNHPEDGFIYFENTGTTFKAHTTPQARNGRWLVIDAADVDQDGDCDLLLGALNFNSKVPPALYQAWSSKKTSILYLKNTTIR